MPVDANGVRAEAIMDGMATVNRMNFGRLYEHYINAASFGLAQEITRSLGIENTGRDLCQAALTSRCSATARCPLATCSV